MKIATVLGTRPEIIRLSATIKSLDQVCDHTLVHTGQNHSISLSDIFFRDLHLRAPDYALEVHECDFARQAGQILERTAALFKTLQPDRVLLLGDTNSSLAAIVAARMQIPVYHMEAGNRCYDDRVPEEINRRIVDHCSTVLMPYTHRSKENLLREGIPPQRIYVIGNPIYEVLTTYAESIAQSDILQRLGLRVGRYFLATLHRAENVDNPERLEMLCRSLVQVSTQCGEPVVMSVHPRTADRLSRTGVNLADTNVQLLDPLSFFDFIKLEREAKCVLTDSGTVQEECAIFDIPNVTLRDVTERPETLEGGSNILSGADPGMVLDAVKVALNTQRGCPPPEYLVPHVSSTVTRLITGYRHCSI